MAVTSTRTITIVFTGDVTGTETIAAASNTTSPGSITIQTLSSGANTITVPNTSTTAVTIVPPSGNAQSMILKGVTGDTGVRLHDTDPTSISLNAATTSFCITAGGTVTACRFHWN